MQRNFLEIRQEMEKIEQSFHIKAYVNMRQQSLSFSTFEKNHSLFKDHLNNNSDVDYFIELGIFERSPLDWEYHNSEKETYRLLLNFVASAIALVDHTRNIVDDLYSEASFHRQYQDKIDGEVKNVPVIKFTQDLRSYVLHNKFPFVSRRIQINRTSPVGDQSNLFDSKIQLALSKQQLSRWEKWTKPSKQYLEAQGEQIYLDVLVDEYFALISRFHEWLNQCQRDMHESEYSWLLDQWKELYQELENSIT